MNNIKSIYLILFLISFSVLCFEIISTRITSVIFVNDYSFIILSFAILGLGSGGIFSYYKIKVKEGNYAQKFISGSLIVLSISLCIFIISVVAISITNPFIYFFLLFLPFFFAGIVYSLIFKFYAEYSFKVYASDLTGAAIGSVASIGALSWFNAPNSILFLAIIILGSAGILLQNIVTKKSIIGFYSILFLSFILLLYNGKNEFLGSVPIGYFPEKDFHYVYHGSNIQSQIIDSRWSIYGRSDLVQYNHQDMVKHLFIDGAAGTQMYRFNGNINKPGPVLLELLLHQSISIPFLFLKESEKNNMLTIGPGGGKEVLIALFGGVEQITGVEINPDFVDIVIEHKNFNGGIYTNFPNVNILVKEGRHYIKQSDRNYDLIVMVLPSTEQMQNIEAFAMSENYLFTVEAIRDYLRILTPEGRLIFTVHNKWELMRLIVTVISAFEEIGIESNSIKNHFAILEAEYAPTIIIKKEAFTKDEISHWQNVMKTVPKDLPAITYLPYNEDKIETTDVNQFLTKVSQNKMAVKKYIEQYEYNISPCKDDSPYFYKIKKGVPDNYLQLLSGIAVFNFIIVLLPFKLVNKNAGKERRKIIVPLAIFICIGAGFIILEISLFQKLILYLGSPTVSLSILLSSLLIGMGIGSFGGKKIYKNDVKKRLILVSILIIITGVILFILYPYILSELLVYSLLFRSLACFLMILPFGFLLGIPFPSCIQILKQENLEVYIPWMYGVNGAMSVLGSVLTVILSMILGMTPVFFIGLFIYLFIPILLFKY
jgi:predicted membrane-bound spermidine synthase